MNATQCLRTLRASAYAGVLLLGLSASAATFTVIDGEGFEAPDYSTTFLGTGQLEGQFASTNGGFGSDQWQRISNLFTSAATVQTAVVASGSQAVRVDRASGSDDRWGVEVSGFPSGRFISIDWDMRVEQSAIPVTPDPVFGPFFGIEANDLQAGADRFGMLGVDAVTGELLYGDAVHGLVPTPGGEKAQFGVWNSFRIVLDFDNDIYYGFMNGTNVITVPFEFATAVEFTDASISAIAASGDAFSDAQTGTAYFDNYFVFETDDINEVIPEPATPLTVMTGLALAAARRR